MTYYKQDFNNNDTCIMIRIQVCILDLTFTFVLMTSTEYPHLTNVSFLQRVHRYGTYLRDVMQNDNPVSIISEASDF